MTLIVSLLFALLALMIISLQKTYTHVPVKELKRRARAGDSLALVLYRASSYGMSLQVLLWVLIGLTSAAFFVTIDRAVPVPIALLGSVILIWVGFAWIPKARVNSASTWLAKALTPIIAGILRYVHPLIDRIVHMVLRHRPVHVHTGLYEKEDLIDLFAKQQLQAGNRISKDELDIAAHALTYGDKIVRQVMTPRRMIKSVSSADALGPVLMTELHASGHSRFPVHEGKLDGIVGMLYLRDVVSARASGTVQNVMKKQVYYVHEEQTLRQTLPAFLKTHHHLFLVVNSFEELVGLITIEDVVEQILGKPIVDEFDKYDDLRAVAASQARQERQEH
ncbi:MAG: exported protein of unknown function [Candidatus Saccharibacteria bacterium]|nr:exported protein of unknown function [Candidatus Saccharibacteria bacterium]